MSAAAQLPAAAQGPAPAAGPAPGYWADAVAAGLAVRHAGHRFVVGSSTDALTGEPGLLVEYADPRALTDGSLETLLAERARRDPAATSVLVRTPAGSALAPPWRRTVTYIRLTGPLRGQPCPDGLRIRTAQERHRAPVREWMARAVRQGAREQGLRVTEDAVSAAVGEVLADGRPTVLVAELAGRPVGHVVLLGAQEDAVTGTVHTELWDVLVEPDAPHAAACRDALVAEGAAHSTGLGLPLTGHVVHRADEAESRALTSLLARGWSTDHAYWSATPADLLARTDPGPAAATGAGGAPPTTPPTVPAPLPPPNSIGSPR